MSFLQHNLVAFLVALVTCSYAWVWGGTRSAYVLSVTPWVWALLLEGMFFFPQRRENETTPEARLRVWRDVCRDPLAWTILAFLILLLIPFLNTALCPVCDAEALSNGAKPGPIVPFLPFCTNRYEHLNVFLWFAPVLTAVLAVRHSLVRSGRRVVIQLVVCSATALALFGFLEIATGAEAPYWCEPLPYQGVFFATFGYANMGADYFMATTLLALALWRARLDETRPYGGGRTHGPRRGRVGLPTALRESFVRHWPLLPAFVLTAATLSTLSRAGILLVTCGAALLLTHALVSHFARLDRLGRVRAGASFLLSFVLLTVAVMSFMPNEVRKEVGTVGTSEVLDRMTGRTEYHADVALRLLKEHPLFGCGGWGYRHYCVPLLSERERELLKYVWTRGGANVHNDSLQFMVEHGILGYALLVFVVILLLVPTASAWRRLARAARFAPRDRRPPPPVSFFALPAPALSILVAAAATFIHSFGDCPLRSPAVLSLFFIELAAIDGFLPDFGDAEDDDDNE